MKKSFSHYDAVIITLGWIPPENDDLCCFMDHNLYDGLLRKGKAGHRKNSD